MNALLSRQKTLSTWSLIENLCDADQRKENFVNTVAAETLKISDVLPLTQELNAALNEGCFPPYCERGHVLNPLTIRLRGTAIVCKRCENKIPVTGRKVFINCGGCEKEILHSGHDTFMVLCKGCQYRKARPEKSTDRNGELAEGGIRYVNGGRNAVYTHKCDVCLRLFESTTSRSRFKGRCRACATSSSWGARRQRVAE